MKQKSFKTARIIKPGIEYRGTRTVASGRLRRSSWKNALSRHAGVLSAARKSYIIEPAGTSVSVCARARLRERERDRGSSPFSVASSLYQERESDGEREREREAVNERGLARRRLPAKGKAQSVAPTRPFRMHRVVFHRLFHSVRERSRRTRRKHAPPIGRSVLSVASHFFVRLVNCVLFVIGASPCRAM
jgi:hypothetical protein